MPVNNGKECKREPETVGFKALACAIIEQAVQDVREARRRGFEKDGKVLAVWENRADMGEVRRSDDEQVYQDAIDFLHDGRLERVCDVIGSRMLHADRIRAQVMTECRATTHNPCKRALN